MSEIHRCWAEVSLTAIRRNVRAIRERVLPGTEIMAVVKANAYGHGSVRVAGALSNEVESFGVANAEEAAVLGPQTRRIYLLSPCLPEERGRVIRSGWIPVVSSAGEAAAYSALGGCGINFKVDTGMGRIGCWHEEAEAELDKVAALPRLHIHSISSHHPSADDDPEFTRTQLEIFRGFCRRIAQKLPGVQTHIANSAGIFGFPAGEESLVRAGLSLYGVASPASHQRVLEPALTWKSRLLLLREIPPGRSISYGQTYTASRTLRVASVAAGYADGYPWQVSGRGAGVLVHGRRCPVLGRVTMDQMLVDISAVPEASVGDEVVLMGRDGAEEITASDLAQKAATIPWHILTGISARVARVYSDA